MPSIKNSTANTLRFERFAALAKEQFGLTIIKSQNATGLSFELIFGFSPNNLSNEELPYDITYDLANHK